MDFIETDDTYYASGLKRSLHGTIYQLKLLMLVVIRAISEKYDFSAWQPKWL